MKESDNNTGMIFVKRILQIIAQLF